MLGELRAWGAGKGKRTCSSVSVCCSAASAAMLLQGLLGLQYSMQGQETAGLDPHCSFFLSVEKLFQRSWIQLLPLSMWNPNNLSLQ